MGNYGKLMELDQPTQADTAETQDEKSEGEVSSATIQSEKKEQNPRYRDTKQPRHHATTIPRHHATEIVTIRGAVKVFGKEAATHRFTLEEKKAIADIVYAYKKKGVKTSENEISRIGVNFLIEDYKVNGENSILQKVLNALND